MKSNSLVSIIIPNLHSPIINEVIKRVLKQNYSGDYEIIVVGQDKYGLLAKFKSQSQIKIITTKKKVNPSGARNIGINTARGDYLFFLDADCLVPPTWISTLLKNHRGKQPRVVGGSFLLERASNFWQFCDNLSHFYAVSSRRAGGKMNDLPTANLSLPRIVVEKVGSFDENLETGEDKDYRMRIIEAGFPLIFEPKAWVIHQSSRTSFFSILKHSYSWGRNSLNVRLKYPQIEKIPLFMKNRLTLILTTPIIALITTMKVYTVSKFFWSFFYTFPVIFLSKVAWCLGAIKGFKE